MKHSFFYFQSYSHKMQNRLFYSVKKTILLSKLDCFAKTKQRSRCSKALLSWVKCMANVAHEHSLCASGAFLSFLGSVVAVSFRKVFKSSTAHRKKQQEGVGFYSRRPLFPNRCQLVSIDFY